MNEKSSGTYIIDEDYNVLFINNTIKELYPSLEVGKKCYQYMLGLNAPCGHCPMKLMDGETEKEVEVDDGIHTFALKARYTT